MRIMYISDYDNTPVVDTIKMVSYNLETSTMYFDKIDDYPSYTIQGIEYDEYRKLAGEILVNGYLDLTDYKVEFND